MSTAAFAADVSATGIAFDTESATVMVGNETILYVTLTPADASDVVRFESGDTNVATVQSAIKDGKVCACVKGVKEGETDIIATVGEFEAVCKLTVEKVIYDYDEVLYTDANLKNVIEEIPLVYANGGKVKDVVINEETGETATVDYKQATYYLDLKNEQLLVKQKLKAGKFITYVTLDEEEIPKLDDKGKITTSKEAKSVASASVKTKNGSTTLVLKAGKKGGRAYVWVIDLRANKTAGKMVKIPIDVKVAPKSVLLFGESGIDSFNGEGIWAGLTTNEEDQIKAIDKKAAVKKITANVGNVYRDWVFRIVSVVDLKTNTVTNDVTYKAVVDEKAKDLIFVEVDDEGYIYLYVRDTNYEAPTKVAKAKITLICNQNGKKTTLSVNIVNDIVDECVSFNSERYNIPDASTQKQTLKIAYDAESIWMDDNTSTYAFESSMTWGEKFDYETKGCSYATTDKIKLYVTSNDKLREEGDNGSYTTYGYTLTKGDKKDTFKLTEKSKEVSAKLDKEGNIILTAKKGTAKGTTAKLLYVATHQDKTIDVYEAIVSVGGEDVKVKPIILCDGKYKTNYVKTGTTRSFDVSIRNPQEGAVLSVKCDDINIATASVSGNTVTFKGVSANNGGTIATLSYIIPATGDKEAVVLATRSFYINVIRSFELSSSSSDNKVPAESKWIGIKGHNFDVEKIEVANLVDKDELIKSYKVEYESVYFTPSGKTGDDNPVFTINAYYDGKVVATIDVEVLFNA